MERIVSCAYLRQRNRKLFLVVAGRKVRRLRHGVGASRIRIGMCRVQRVRGRSVAEIPLHIVHRLVCVSYLARYLIGLFDMAKACELHLIAAFFRRIHIACVSHRQIGLCRCRQREVASRVLLKHQVYFVVAGVLRLHLKYLIASQYFVRFGGFIPTVFKAVRCRKPQVFHAAGQSRQFSV